jgi:aryl-alcohol dehydrogenase-like predicted oxidoreductase
MISSVAFGAGPVSGLMTTADAAAQRAAVERALARGINWFDTAAGYGAGQSEAALGAALQEVDCSAAVHVATKVRLGAEDLSHIKEAVKRSVAQSLQRLRRERVTLLQLHNSVTTRRGEQPTSITPEDVLGHGGVWAAFEELHRDGVVEHFGLTGLGHRAELMEVIHGAPWLTIQINEHALIRRQENGFLSACAELGLAVLAIRVFAGGALSGQPASAHTLKTPFFPLHIYERDAANARRLASLLPPELSLPELAVRHVLGNPHITSAIIGFAHPDQIDEIARWAARGPLSANLRALLNRQPLPQESP